MRDKCEGVGDALKLRRGIAAARRAGAVVRGGEGAAAILDGDMTPVCATSPCETLACLRKRLRE
jgi:hypothetical protein